MAIKRTKKKKSISEVVSHRVGSSARQTSDKRPVHEERTPPCIAGCPQGTPVREAVNTISLHEKHALSLEESFTRAWQIWTDVSPFPAILGRVCPALCEDQCNRREKDDAVGVNRIERFLGDWGIEHGFKLNRDDDAGDYDEKIAVIGSGPSGLNCAYYLARRGYKVTIFEAFARLGGMLRYGIPEYRLPRNILDAEIQRILDLGVEVRTNVAVGRDTPFEQLDDEFDAVYVAIGAHKGRKLGLDGEDGAENVVTGIEFLNRMNTGNTPDVGDRVVVVGGGDSAMDAARVCRRLGADVTLLYRRTRNEMPAIEEDIAGGEKEQINFIFLGTPVELTLNDNRCTTIKCRKMELGEPDSSGRRRPVPIDEFFELECSFLIPSISQEPEFDGFQSIGANAKDWLSTDDFMEKDAERRIYAGGDARELGLVTTAMYHGRRAADTMHARFRGLPITFGQQPPEIKSDKLLLDYFEPKPRVSVDELDPERRVLSLTEEIERTFSESEVLAEAQRCLSCGMCFECGQCWTYCQDQAVLKPVKPGEKYTFKLELCQGCCKCEEVCPCGYIQMK
ncbi:MAG: NADPH-Fe(3+) oxidoreductase subunit beta [Calditrichaeota bacterium]|nr:NADPH-Fe(3+) oxidoreductase subunit beta [Calditrichota bacterium]